MAHPYLVRIKWKVRSSAQDSPGVWVGTITKKKRIFQGPILLDGFSSAYIILSYKVTLLKIKF